MRLITLLLSLWSIAVPAVASDVPDEPRPARLALYVFDHGRPLPGVHIELNDRPWAITSRRGAVIANLPPGEHRLTLRHRRGLLDEATLRVAADDELQLIVSLDENGVHTDLEQRTATADGAREEEQKTGPPGILEGRLLSAEDGAPVTGARLFLSGVSLQGRSDQDGRYRLQIPAGRYTLSIIHPRYASLSREVEITPQGVTRLELQLVPAGVELEEYLVLAPHIQGSVAAVVDEVRTSSEVMEALGAEQMSRAGDSHAAGALRRVTGLTLEQGRYVVIRGQPSRYTLTLLDGSPLPSPDPIRRLVPLDLFPTHALSAVRVQKTYSPDRPGDFAGGLVELSLRGLPESPFARVKVQTGGNEQTTFKDGLDYRGGASDIWGRDDGTRAIPPAVLEAGAGGTVNLNSLPQAQRVALGRAFPNNYALFQSRVPLDQGLSLVGGDRRDGRWGRYGILAGLSWKRSHRQRQEIDRDLYLLGPGQAAILNDFRSRRSDTRINLGGLVILGGQWGEQRLTLSNFFIRDTIKRAQVSEGLDRTSDDRYERNYLLDWNQRQLQLQQLRGHHPIGGNLVQWRWLTARGRRDAPDRRSYTYQRLPDGRFVLYEETGVQRLYNQVDDRIGSGGIDLERPLWQGQRLSARIKLGLAWMRQQRRSDTSRYRFEPSGGGLDLSAPIEDILAPANIGQGIAFIDDTQSNDDYRAQVQVDGRYVLIDLDWSQRLRLVAGMRQESADYRVETFAASSRGRNVIPGGFQRSDLLPALSATWFIGERQQLRAAYSATLARPEVVELSATLFYDPDSGEAYLGNPELQPAAITNYDLRWEAYPSPQESLSLGLFLRDYRRPIERAFIPVAGGGQNITFQNAAGATVYGIEAGTRLDLSRWLPPGLALQANLTLMQSRVRLAANSLATSEDRPLQGQADYLLNTQLIYDGERHDLALSLNRVGRRLDKTGVQGLPDIYRSPYSDLGLTWSWQPRPRLRLKLKASNLLDSEQRYSGAGLVERAWKTGRSLSLSLDWRLR